MAIIGIVLLVLLAVMFFYIFRGYAVALVLGVPAFGLVMLACGANDHDFAVGIIFAIVVWFIWVFRGLRKNHTRRLEN
jgi:hypothetical protein